MACFKVRSLDVSLAGEQCVFINICRQKRGVGGRERTYYQAGKRFPSNTLKIVFEIVLDQTDRRKEVGGWNEAIKRANTKRPFSSPLKDTRIFFLHNKTKTAYLLKRTRTSVIGGLETHFQEELS